MATDTTYEIWVLGENEDHTANDYERLVCGFIDNERWAWELFRLAEDIVSKPVETPNARLVLEQVYKDTCVNVLAETELGK